MKELKLYWWTPNKYSKFTIIGRLNGEYYRYANVPSNFGDELSHFIVSSVLNTKVVQASKSAKGKLLGIGSILHQAQDGDVVWGSGINGKYLDRRIVARDLKILSVRGPLTRAYLMECGYEVPEIYGDPAVLTPLYYQAKQFEEKLDYAYVPHFSELKGMDQDQMQYVINPTLPFNEVVDKIVNTKKILSSSLHGIILAEAYGIPAILIRANENEPIFKYEDYYRGTGRTEVVFARSIEEGLNMTPPPPAQVNQEALIQSLKNWFSHV